MKQIFLVGLKVDISYDLLEKKLFNGWQVYKSYTNEYAISKVRPYYAESLEKAKYRYIKDGLCSESWGLKDIYKSSDNFDWDIFCKHKKPISFIFYIVIMLHCPSFYVICTSNIFFSIF